MNAEKRELSRKSYVVEIEALTTHQFVVPDCYSLDEAEAIAEEWFHDGEEGEILTQEISRVDSYPEADKEDFN